MKIAEITSTSSKLIKKLQRLYASYILNPEFYETLYTFLAELSKTTDPELLKEVDIVKSKLKRDMLEVLKK